MTYEGLLTREGWDKAFKKSSKEKLLISDVLENQFDKDEWVCYS